SYNEDFRSWSELAFLANFFAFGKIESFVVFGGKRELRRLRFIAGPGVDRRFNFRRRAIFGRRTTARNQQQSDRGGGQCCGEKFRPHPGTLPNRHAFTCSPDSDSPRSDDYFARSIPEPS